MKILNKIIVIFIIIFAMTNSSYCLDIKINKNKNLNTLFYIEEKNNYINNEFLDLNITYPFLNIDKEIVIKENYDSKFLENINIDIFDFINSFENEMLLISNEYKINFKNKKSNSIKYKFEGYSEYKKSYNKNNILSIPILMYSFTGGAHGNSYLKSFNYDLYNKKELKLHDLFKVNTNYKKPIEDFIKSEISKNPTNYFYKENFKIKDEQEFYIDEDNIVIYFQTYDIAPYYMGIVEFKIPFDKLQNLSIK